VTKESLEARRVEPSNDLRLVIQGFGKKFNRNWIFRDVHLELNRGEYLAISGGNGSGKSTFIQCVLGTTGPTTGTSDLYVAGKILEEDRYSNQFSIAAPYAGLFEDFTLRESIQFHTKFKRLEGGMDPEKFAEVIGLSQHIDKPILQYSSGMKQRVKLGLALYSEVSVILLDEPCSHLDERGIVWYKEQISVRKEGKIVLVASNNMETETFFCKRVLHMGIKNIS
jgi:ABC-type multidrug transport system ATPase subunit